MTDVISVYEDLEQKDDDYLDEGEQLDAADAKQPTDDQIILPDDALVNIEGEVAEIDDGKEVRRVLAWKCVVNKINVLLVGGQTLQARVVKFRIGNIEWRAGQGWPIYKVPCPTNNYKPDRMTFPWASVHSIVPEFGGQYWKGACEAWRNYTGTGKRVTRVRVGVNDDRYDDNRGAFMFYILAWKK